MRDTTTAIIYGEIKTLCEWAKISDIELNTIRTRYRRGIRGTALLDPPSDRIATHKDIHDLWGGKWVYTGKPVRNVKWNKNARWVYVGRDD